MVDVKSYERKKRIPTMGYVLDSDGDRKYFVEVLKNNGYMITVKFGNGEIKNINKKKFEEYSKKQLQYNAIGKNYLPNTRQKFELVLESIITGKRFITEWHAYNLSDLKKELTPTGVRKLFRNHKLIKIKRLS
jgi:hypothetical protein